MGRRCSIKDGKPGLFGRGEEVFRASEPLRNRGMGRSPMQTTARVERVLGPFAGMFAEREQAPPRPAKQTCVQRCIRKGGVMHFERENHFPESVRPSMKSTVFGSR